MVAAGLHEEVLELRLSDEETTVACGAELLVVPSVCAARSELLNDLRQQTEGDAVLPLDLSKRQLQAWLACAKEFAGLSETFDHPADESDAGKDESDELLLDALKATDFLRDHGTMGLVQEKLGAAVLGTQIKAAPTGAERARAVEIMRAVTPEAALCILQAIQRRFTPAVNSAHFPLTIRSSTTPAHHMHRLLRLLPSTFHPAVVRACCAIPGAEHSCRIDMGMPCNCMQPDPGAARPAWLVAEDHTLPCRVRLAARPAWAHANPIDISAAVAHACTPQCATPTFQLLAAAAPLAGGSMRSVWEADDAVTPLDPSTARSARDGGGVLAEAPQPPAKRCRPADPQERRPSSERLWIRPAGHLTRLEFVIPRRSEYLQYVHHRIVQAYPEPPRWCAALAHLCTLRQLSVSAPNLPELHVPRLLPMLRGLAPLQDLSLDIAALPGGEDDHEFHNLLHGVCELTRLAVLRIDTGEPPSPLDNERTVCMCRQLENLTALTRFRFYGPKLDSDCVVQLFQCLEHVESLRHVDVGVQVCDGTPGHMYSSIANEHAPRWLTRYALLSLCEHLPALRSVHVRGVWLSDRGPNPFNDPFNCETIHHRIRDRNPALLSRMTEFPQLFWEDAVSDSGRLGAFLADLPALQSLDLQYTKLTDEGLLKVAAVLPRMPHLTCLNVGHTGATHKGLRAVLAGVLGAWPAGEARLRKLCFDGTDLEVSAGSGCERNVHMHLAGLLRKFNRLEELSMWCLMWKLSLEMARAIVLSLRAEFMPRLRFVDLRDGFYVGPEGREGLLALLRGMTHIRDIKWDGIPSTMASPPPATTGRPVTVDSDSSGSDAGLAPATAARATVVCCSSSSDDEASSSSGEWPATGSTAQSGGASVAGSGAVQGPRRRPRLPEMHTPPPPSP